MKNPPTITELKFAVTLERIAPGINYFHVVVPEKITKLLGTRAAVSITARINDGKLFRGSFYPMGEGRHGMRVKAKVRKAAGIEEGDRVRVRIEVVDRAVETELLKDVEAGLAAEGALAAFRALPPGKRSFLLRGIESATKAETRAKRIRSVVREAIATAEKSADRVAARKKASR